MDLASPKFHQSPSLFSSNVEPPPPLEAFDVVDPLCKLNLKETSEFVRSFPMPSAPAQKTREGVNSVTLTQRITALDYPSTPGRPIFSFSGGGGGGGVGGNNYGFLRKGFPSKWDDAEKWLIRPQHQELFADKSRVTQEKVSKGSPLPLNHYHHHHYQLHHYSSGRAAALNGVSVSASPEALSKDKFTDDVETILPNSRSSDPSKEGFLFRNSVSSSAAASEPIEGSDSATQVVIHEVQHRDAGTEMTPRGSSTNSRCHTPFQLPSPPRHNTPADRSGPLPISGPEDSGTTVNISRQLQECHLAKLHMGAHQFDSVTSNWSSREEEEEEVSKSLRHYEVDSNCNSNVFQKTAAYWEEEEKNKCCLRYQREEAKIRAWVNLESAKAEAQSRKLEVKIQKMRSNLEEKLMKRMATVHRKAEEWLAEARQQHTEQIHRAKKKMIDGQDRHLHAHQRSCGCFH